jgi:hypothetical protein
VALALCTCTGTYLTVSQEEEILWKNGIFSHYCYKRDDLCQILKFLAPKPMRDVGRENAVHRAPVVFPQNAKKAPGRFIKQQMKWKERDGYKRLPGTRMKRQQSAASTSAIHARHMSARLLRSFLSCKSIPIPQEAKMHSEHT